MFEMLQMIYNQQPAVDLYSKINQYLHCAAVCEGPAAVLCIRLDWERDDMDWWGVSVLLQT